MIRGEKVTVIFHDAVTGTDRYGDEVRGDLPVDVDNVLVEPGNQSNLSDARRPDGVSIDLTLRFPRAWEYRSLRGCNVTVRGISTYEVLGDPLPIDGGLTPTAWNMTVLLHDTRG